MSAPFTDAQEARIREIVAEELARLNSEARGYVNRLREAVDASRPGVAPDVQ